MLYNHLFLNSLGMHYSLKTKRSKIVKYKKENLYMDIKSLYEYLYILYKI